MDVVEREQIDRASLGRHWYYEAKYQLLKRNIQSLPLDRAAFTTADVGAGLGIFLHKLERDGLASPERSVGVDPAYTSPQPAYQSKISIHPGFPEGRCFDLLLMMDVLEHVECDLDVLQHAIQHGKRGGYVFITLPALPFLWSSHDRFLGHYRRYTLRTLERLIRDTGKLTLLHSHYYFASVLPMAIPIRLLKAREKTPSSSDMKSLPRLLNRLLQNYCNLELPLGEWNRLAGLTVVALCRIES